MSQAHPTARTIGIIAPQLSSLYYGELLSGIHAVLQPHAIELVAIQAAPREVAELRLAARLVAGWIVVNAADQVERLAQFGAPIVTVGVVAADTIPAVLPDNHSGMRAVVAHLIAHGHRAIAFMGSLAHFDIRQRYEGYLSALADAGIAAEPALCLDLPANTMADGREALRRLIAAEARCTAVAAATDELAIGLLQQGELERSPLAGLAVVGFDNIIPGQTSRPPLTTVAVSAHAIGASAGSLMLRRLAGDTAAPPITYVPTALVLRNSCGCAALGELAPLPESPAELDADAVLLARLARALLPESGGAGEPPELAWPAGQVLVRGLAAAVDGAPPPSRAALVQACQEAVGRNGDVDRVMALALELERAGGQRLAGRADPAAQARLSDLLALVRGELVRAMIGQTRSLYLSIFDQVQQNQQASVRLLGGDDQDVRALAWMAELPFSAGCLGLWERGAPAEQLVVAGSYGSASAPGDLADVATFPRDQLPTQAAGQADLLTVLLPVRSPEHNWGILALRVTISYLWSSVHYNMLGVLVSQLDLALSRQLLRERFASEQARALALSNQVRELSCPVIPLFGDVLLVPLIGALDAARIPQIMEAVLQGVTEQQASHVLIDITGVPLVDTQAANALVQTAQAATLLGARVSLVGIRPEIAQSIIGLGIDLRLIATEATLSAALRRLMRAR